MSQATTQAADLGSAVRDYWNHRIHDLEMTREPVGTRAFFDDLDAYRFDKLDYLPKVVDFASFSGQRVLEDRLRHRHRSRALLPGRRAGHRGLTLPKPRSSSRARTSGFTDCRPRGCAFADGGAAAAAQRRVSTSSTRTASCSTPRIRRSLIAEAHRVLRPGGRAIFMVYNRVSWLNAMSKLMKVPLEHEDAPVLADLLDSTSSAACSAAFRHVRDRSGAISR